MLRNNGRVTKCTRIQTHETRIQIVIKPVSEEKQPGSSTICQLQLRCVTCLSVRPSPSICCRVRFSTTIHPHTHPQSWLLQVSNIDFLAHNSKCISNYKNTKFVLILIVETAKILFLSRVCGFHHIACPPRSGISRLGRLCHCFQLLNKNFEKQKTYTMKLFKILGFIDK